MNIDLHTHTIASDGSMTPTELAIEAKKRNLHAIALTDHDTIEGLPEFISACKELEIEAVAGVELSAAYSCELHIIGLYVDYTNEFFIKELETLRHFREERNKKSIDILASLGFDIKYEDVSKMKPGGRLDNIGRAHLARLLAQRGYVENVKDGFKKYLGDGCIAYSSKQKFSPAECISLIHSANGKAFLAHPVFVTKDFDELEKLIVELKNVGLDGIEAIYSEQNELYQSVCVELANKHNLLISGGSDFHADNKPHISLGKSYGDKDIPYSLLERIKGN